MKVKNAVVGSLESSDVMVTVSPSETLELIVESIVKKQFGKRIESVAKEMISAAGINAAKIKIQDKGALECTLRARIETAIARAQA